MKTLEQHFHRVMELISAVKDTWKVFIIGAIISCLMLLLLLHENDQNTSFPTHARITAVGNFPPPLSGESESSSIVANDMEPSIFTTASILPPLPSIVVMAPEPSAHTPPSMIFMAPEPLPSNIVKAPEPSIFPTSIPPPLPSNIVKAPEPSSVQAPEPFSVQAAPEPSSVQAPEPSSVQAPEPSIFTTYSQPSFGSMIANHPVEKPNLNLVDDIQKPNVSGLDKAEKKPVNKKCDIYDGRWVYKADAEPTYCPLKCPFVEEKMSCKKNGRPDLEYEKWVWQPRDCDIPMLNGTDLVERFRNKRIVLVGDSLNRNMWESLACTLYSNIPYPSLKAQILYEDLHVRTFMKAKEDYNFTVEFFWSPFLVEINKNHESGKKVLVLDRLANPEQWLNADILIFNSGHHWTQVPPKRAWDIFEYKGKLIEKMPLHQAFTRAMRTWASWVETKTDPKKTTVFFRSLSVEHISSFHKQSCETRTEPFMDESYKFIFPRTLVRVAENVVKGMKKSQVKYLNITKLTEYRIDAHPSIYRFNDWKIRIKNNKLYPPIIPDCGHWCLPGVPDTWNRLVYASLFFDNYGDVSSS
nr:protein trichome birefringence-like 42 isoform X4 [Spinacia oleracea]